MDISTDEKIKNELIDIDSFGIHEFDILTGVLFKYLYQLNMSMDSYEYRVIRSVFYWAVDRKKEIFLKECGIRENGQCSTNG